MQILDQDMQMVRDFLKGANAPFYITSHFENLVSEHAKEAERAEELKDEVKKLRGACVERDELKEQVDELEADLERRDGHALRALETVKYWLLDVLVHGRPMQTPPSRILRIVEDVV